MGGWLLEFRNWFLLLLFLSPIDPCKKAVFLIRIRIQRSFRSGFGILIWIRIQGLKNNFKMLNHRKIILLLKHYISQLTSFIFIPGSVKKQLGPGSGFRGLLNPDPDSTNMDPKHWCLDYGTGTREKRNVRRLTVWGDVRSYTVQYVYTTAHAYLYCIKIRGKRWKW